MSAESVPTLLGTCLGEQVHTEHLDCESVTSMTQSICDCAPAKLHPWLESCRCPKQERAVGAFVTGLSDV